MRKCITTPWIWIDKASGEALNHMVKAFRGSLVIKQIFDDTYELTCSSGSLPEKQAEMQTFAFFLRDKFFEGE